MTNHNKVYQETVDLIPANGNSITAPEFKVFKRRWAILVIYVLYSAINSFQSFQYAIISNTLMRYYGLSSVQVDWMSIVYMVAYLPLVIPASFIMEKKGLRTTALIGCIGTALGTGIKIFSINKEHAYLIYVGQIILSSMVVFIQPLPPRIAAVWFGPDQVSLACGLGTFGTFIGQTLGLFLPPLIVGNHEDVSLIGRDLGYLTYTISGLSIFMAIAVIIYFPAMPPEPPSINQAIDRSKSNTYHKFLSSLKQLLLDPIFLLHSLAYGLILGVCFAIITLFAQEMMIHFPDRQDEIGQIMLSMAACGMVAIVFFGFLLDKSRKYNETAIALCFLISLGLAGYTYALEIKSITLVYVSVSLVGFISNGYIIAGFELAIELTYPEPEATTTGILIAISQTSGALLSILLGYLIQEIGSLWSLCTMIFLCFVSALITTALPKRLKRQTYVDFDPIKTIQC